MPRPRNLRPVAATITRSTDGRWHGFVTVGTKPDGSPDRRHRSGLDRDKVEAAIRKLEDARARGRVTKAGRAPTVAEYLRDWLADPGRRYKTQEDYARVVERHLIPYLGRHRVADDGLTQDHVRAMMRAVERDLSASAAHRAHRILRSALSEAMRRGLASRNVASLAKPPVVEESEVEPLTPDEVERVLAEVYRQPRNRSRWLLALTVGMRQGECLGLALHRPDQPRLPGDVDLDTGTIRVREKQLRHKWLHGCRNPIACVKTLGRCRTGPCPTRWAHGCGDPSRCKAFAHFCPRKRRQDGCNTHRGDCPPPCPRNCDKHARHCPQRHGGGLVKEPPKSAAGRRPLALPPPVVEALRWDLAQRDRDREAALDQWTETGLLYVGVTGKAIDPRADWQQWHDILTAAGVPSARLHDARHTAATTLLALGVDKRVAMAIGGWSDARMLDRYQHVVDEMTRDAAERIAAKWWPQSADSATSAATTAKPKRRKGHLRVV